MRLPLTLLLTIISFGLFAQTFTISGLVQNSTNKSLPGAHIALLHPWGEGYKSNVSSTNGSFRLEGVSKGGYALKITFLGYQNYKTEINISNQHVDLGVIVLKEEATDLNEIEVTEKIPLATQLEDTTQYNADAFKTLKDASAEELIEKMPGVVIQDGKIQAQGEDVKEVLVDGRPFFGNDPNAALKNLPAEVIDKIQIFDKQSDQAQFSGFDDGETSKTINIITKTNMRTGQFGKVYAGYGDDNKYQAGGNASLFNGDQRISIIAQSNNVNQQNFSTEDLLGVVSSGNSRGRGRGGRGGRGGSGSVNDFLVSQQDGIAQTHAFGFNYSDRWGKKTEVSGSYFYNYTDNDAGEFSKTTYLDNQNANDIYFEDNNSNALNQNHRFNMRLVHEIDSVNSIILRPRLTLQDNNGYSKTDAQTFSLEELLNQTQNDFSADLFGIDFSNTLLYRRRMAKRGRTFSVRLGTGYKKNSGESFLYSQNDYFIPRTSTDTLDQFSNLDLNGWNLSSNISYTEPIGRIASLQFRYSYSWQEDKSDKETMDFSPISNKFDILNEQLSNVFTNHYKTHQIGTGINIRKGRNLFFMTRASLQFSQLESDDIFPLQAMVNRKYVNFIPFAMFRFRKSRSENIRVFYRSNTQSPSVEQLQNVVDNTNPLQLSIGNPKLDQSVNHSISLRYNKTNTEKSTVMYFFLTANITDNYISNATYLSGTDNPIFTNLNVEPGTQLTRPVNLDGYWNTRTYFTYGFPVYALKSNLNIDVNASYTRSPGLINDELNHSKNRTAGAGITLSSNISDRLDFTVSTRGSYNTVENTIQSDANQNYWNQQSKIRFGWVLPKGIVFRAGVTHQFYEGLGDEFENNFLIWNLGIGKKLFKNQRGELTLSVADLLRQNQSINRNVTASYIQDIETNVLQRYAMLTFTYNFRNFKTSKKKTRNEGSGEERRKRF